MSGWDLGREVQTFAVLLSHAVEPDDKGSTVLRSAVHHLPSLAQSTAASSTESNKTEIKSENTSNTSHQDCITSVTPNQAELSTGNNQHCLVGWPEANQACLHTAVHKVSLWGMRKDYSYLLWQGQCSSHSPRSVFMGITFWLWGCSLAIKLLLVQCVTKRGRFTHQWGSARSKKDAAGQRNPRSLLPQGLLALSHTDSLGRLKIQLALLRRNKREVKKKGKPRKSFVYRSSPWSPSSSLCYDKRSLGRPWGSAYGWKWWYSWPCAAHQSWHVRPQTASLIGFAHRGLSLMVCTERPRRVQPVWNTKLKSSKYDKPNLHFSCWMCAVSE